MPVDDLYQTNVCTHIGWSLYYAFGEAVPRRLYFPLWFFEIGGVLSLGQRISRMELSDIASDVVFVKVRVDFRCGDAFVAEHLLYRT